MTKHVRFASLNTIYHASKSSSTKSISSRTLPDELLRVSTTSSHPYARPRARTSSQAEPPYGHKPSTVLHASHLPMRLHFLLAYSPYKEPSIPYDLSLPFSIIEQSPSNSILSEPATEPPVSSLTITCPLLKWNITVTPPPSIHSMQPSVRRSPVPYVSVLDVLMALLRDMSIPVLPVEYESLPSREITAKVNEAYFQRCRSIADPAIRSTEELRGVKRVDFLMGQNRFLGLSSRPATRRGETIWELNVGPSWS